MKLYYETDLGKMYHGCALDNLRHLAAQGVKVQMCVTSPPYWGLRDYGVDGQIGLESTPEEYTAKMVEVFGLVRDILADDGILWLNLGDSYAVGYSTPTTFRRDKAAVGISKRPMPVNLKPKNLIGIPWRIAFALQADGWYLRQDIIWHKPNPMPESVTDRCTKAHEYLFLLSKNERYFYDSEAIKIKGKTHEYDARCRGEGRDYKKEFQPWTQNNSQRPHKGFKNVNTIDGVNKRSVWTIPIKPFAEAHFATYPPALITPCILAGSRPGDIVLDPFFGSGTTGEVCEKYGRGWIGIELNRNYVDIAVNRVECERLQMKLSL